MEPAQASPLETSSLTTSAPLSPVTRFAWTALIVFTLGVCYFSHLGAIGFVGPDEPRYAWIARDMAETGDWVTPRLYGKPWFEKPPLYYWSAAISFKLFGVSETAARLPSAVAALLATLALAWLALRVYGAETARWLLLLLPTSIGMIGFSHAASTDMLFSATLTLALVAACVVLRLMPGARSAPVIPSGEPQSPAARSRGIPAGSAQATNRRNATQLLALVPVGFFLGLAMLAKGPAAIILLGGAIFFWAVFTKRWRDVVRLFHPVALAAFFLTALPWYILCARRNPDFFRIFIIEHNLKRYLTPEFQHIQPFWYYAAVLLVAFLPWTALCLWSLISGSLSLWRTRRISDATLLLLCWSAFCVLFFTVSKSKLPGYILPAVPAIGLVTANICASSRQSRSVASRFLFSAVGATLVLLGALARHFAERLPFVTDIRPSPDVTSFADLMVLGGIITALLTLLRLGRTALAVPLLTIVAWMVWGAEHLQELDDGVSARPAVVILRDRLTERQLQGVTTYKLRRDFAYEVKFYLRREAAEWSASNPDPSVILTNWKEQKGLEQMGVRCPAYEAVPAVTICEDVKDGKPLMHAPRGGETK